MAAATVARAEPPPPSLGTNASGLRGLVYTGLPLSEPELNLSIGAGYGATESLAPDDGMHHRGQAGFGAAITPLPWLSFGLKLDGRLEMHPDDGDGAHAAGFGDPRIFARGGYALSPEFSLGAELGAWFPGTEAPSIEPSATSIEGRGLFAFTPRGSPWIALAALGYRVDNSAKAAPDVSRLRQGDRISLGLSNSNAILAALGLARRFGDRGEAFVELSADMLAGEDAPAFGSSPLRAALGGRYFATSAWQFDLTTLVSLSSRPEIGENDPLVPIEPRIVVALGARYSVGLHAQAPIEHEVEAPPTQVEPVDAAPPKPAPKVAVSGSLVDDKGEALPEVRVTMHAEGGDTREAISDANGRYSFDAVQVGPASFEVEATGFESQTWQLEVRPDMPQDGPRALKPKTDSGVLRGLIRTFQSEPLRAQIVVRDKRGRAVATRESAEDGHFEIDVPPGAYEVTISARGYRTQRRATRVEGNGVAILNVDMREDR